MCVGDICDGGLDYAHTYSGFKICIHIAGSVIITECKIGRNKIFPFVKEQLCYLHRKVNVLALANEDFVLLELIAKAGDSLTCFGMNFNVCKKMNVGVAGADDIKTVALSQIICLKTVLSKSKIPDLKSFFQHDIANLLHLFEDDDTQGDSTHGHLNGRSVLL